MRLLYDQNLSPWLVAALENLYPDSIHVRDLSLRSASDEDIWTFARSRNLVIVSKDADFRQRSFLYGYPAKVIWIQVGNCSTTQIEHLLRARARDLLRFEQDPEAAFLALR